MIRRIRNALVILATTLAMLEVTLLISVHAGIVALPLPSYSLDLQPFFGVIDPVFGYWHYPNVVKRQAQACFDVTYQTNSFGMRDKEVTLHSTEPRVVVLGDSFVEGFGVEYGQRFTEYLEGLTGIEHLDFGLRGAGTTAEYLIYERLASRFDHQGIIWMVLPLNDFVNDEPTPTKLGHSGVWPYLVGSYPNYQVASPARNKVAQAPSRDWSNLLVNNSMVAGAASYLWEYWRYLRPNLQARVGAILGSTGSYYYDYSKEQFDRLRFVIERLKILAGERPMLLVTIPGPADYMRARQSGTTPPLRPALAKLTGNLNIQYLDLMQVMDDPHFLSCSPHWTEYGNELVAKAIARSWIFYPTRTMASPSTDKSK